MTKKNKIGKVFQNRVFVLQSKSRDAEIFSCSLFAEKSQSFFLTILHKVSSQSENSLRRYEDILLLL